MDTDAKQLHFPKSLWVEHRGVRVSERAGTVTIEGVDEDSTLKVFNAFGRVLKLYTFEGGRWIDVDTGGPPGPLDDREAGRLPGSPEAASPPAAPRKKATVSQKVAPKAGKGGAGKGGKKPARASQGRKSERGKSGKATKPR